MKPNTRLPDKEITLVIAVLVPEQHINRFKNV